MVESLLGLIVLIVIGGLIWYLVTLLPLPSPVKIAIQVLCILVLIVLLWQYFLPLGHLHR